MPSKPPPIRRGSPSPGAEPRPDAGRFVDSEAPTEPKGLEFQASLLILYYRQMAPEDRKCLMRNAEQWAARNRK
jgi:hypothetical protein